MKHNSDKTLRRTGATCNSDLEAVRGGVWYRTNVLGDLGAQIDALEAGAPDLGGSGPTPGSVDLDDRSDYVGNGNPFPQ